MPTRPYKDIKQQPIQIEDTDKEQDLSNSLQGCFALILKLIQTDTIFKLKMNIQNMHIISYFELSTKALNNSMLDKLLFLIVKLSDDITEEIYWILKILLLTLNYLRGIGRVNMKRSYILGEFSTRDH